MEDSDGPDRICSLEVFHVPGSGQLAQGQRLYGLCSRNPGEALANLDNRLAILASSTHHHVQPDPAETSRAVGELCRSHLGDTLSFHRQVSACFRNASCSDVNTSKP
eukprot:scaffold157580_cov36-Tisochrysis_lutea.AAC.3